MPRAAQTVPMHNVPTQRVPKQPVSKLVPKQRVSKLVPKHRASKRRVPTSRSRSTFQRVLLSILSVGLVSVGETSSASAQDLAEVSRKVTDIDGRLSRLTKEPLRRSAVRSPTYVEERLTDGELFYRLQDYIRASIVFTDIVENHPTHAAYPDALFLLGESLFKAGDYLGARTRFRLVLEKANQSGFAPFTQRSLGRLIEIAIHIRDFDGVEGHFQQLSRIPSSEVEASTAYFRAKYLYSRAVPTEEALRGTDAKTVPKVDLPMVEQARVAFEAVADGSAYYLQARYFIGVVHTLRGEYPQAIEAFRRVLRTEPTTSEQRKVTDLTHLALGRLYYETDQLDQSVEAYQAVPRTSTEFDTALYEISWVYIRLGDSTRAERALEVLAVAVPDSQYIPDAKVLRGNLLLRNGRFDDAEGVFREVRREFGPVYRELEAIRVEHEGSLLGYFQGLVRQNMEDFDVNDFLPENARRWAVPEGDFKRAVKVLEDLAESRRLVEETQQLIVRLNAALTAPNRVSIFRDLRRQREGTTALRNRLSRERQSLIRIEEKMSPNAGPELLAVRDRRRRIERALGGMPTGEDDFVSRDDQLLGRYRGLSRDLSELEVELLGMDARIVATERYLEDTKDNQNNADSVRAELETQRGAVASYRKQIEEIEGLIEIGRIQVGVGDARYQRDDRLREEYRKVVAQERALSGNTNPEAERVFQRITSIERKIDTRDAEIDAVVEERVKDMRRVIKEESGHIVGYRTELAALEGETEEVVGAVTYENFKNVRNRFYDLVLRADVGRIDVSWARREEHRMRVDMLTRERSREIQALDDEFRDIMDEDNGDEDEVLP